MLYPGEDEDNQKRARAYTAQALAEPIRQFVETGGTLAEGQLIDQYAVLNELGFSPAEIQHLQRVHVAHAMGDQAPQELKVLAQMGPQISTTSAIAATVESLSRRLDEQDKRKTQEAAAQSFKSLISDKSKYPNLSVAYAADPSLFEGDVGGGEDVAAIADKLEKRQAALAAVYAPKSGSPSASSNAGYQQVESVQGKPAIAGAMSGDPPPIPTKSQGVFTQDDHVKLRDEVVRKHTPSQS
jgi:hypothetical protein